MVRRSGSGTKRGKKSRRVAKKSRRTFKWPKAFRIVPITVKSRPKKHAHVFGAAGVPPCPPGCTYVTKKTVGPLTYCVYVDLDGLDVLVLC